MTTSYPTTLDALANPSGSDTLGTAAVLHSAQHANINDAVEALQAKVGADSSAVVTSLDYLLRHIDDTWLPSSLSAKTFTGQITSTLANGTAPLVVASSTLVANLYAARAALSDTVTTNANLTGPITSSGNATSVASQTGTGSTFVMKTSPTLVTPTLGVATATSLTTGSITNSSLTSGRIPVAGTAGLMQDYAGLAIVGTPSATAPSTATLGPGLLGGIQCSGADGAQTGLTATAFGNGAGAQVNISGYANEGTGASPGATTSGDRVFLSLRGFDGTNYTNPQASVALTAGSTWTPSSQEAYIQFVTCPSGTTSRVTAGRFDGNGVLVMGGGFNSVGTFSAGTLRPHIQTASTVASNAGIAQTMWSASASGPTGIFAKSRSATVGTQGVITTGDTLGTLSWQGDDGTNFIAAAQIVGVSTGTIATGQVPGLLRFSTASSAGTMTNAAQFDSAQNLVIGNTATAGSALYTGGTATPRVQMKGTVALTTGMSVANFGNASSAGSFFFAKSRGTTIDTMTVVTTGDTLGTIDWQGADGTNFVSAARIIVTATGTVGSTQVPGNMVFQTGTNASPSVLTTAITIDNAQMVTFAGDITRTDAKNWILGSSTGNKLGTATTQKLGFWNAAPVAQYATTGTTTGFTAGVGTTAKSDSTYTGNTGSTAYTTGDIVRALKLAGIMAA